MTQLDDFLDQLVVFTDSYTPLLLETQRFIDKLEGTPKVWNRMTDPGDGSLHQEYNFTLLKYAGDMKWSYEEDVYNPAPFGEMVAGWMKRKQELGGE